MKKTLLTSLGVLMMCFGSHAQTTVSISCTGTTGSYNSGSVNSAGTVNDGSMITINSTTNRGFAKFDLSTLPSAAVIMSVTCNFTTYSSTSSSATNNLYGFVGNPSGIAGATLYTDCASGTSFNASTWTANSALSKVLNASGISFVQSNYQSPNLCIGFVRGSTNTYNIYGYPGTAAQQPQLVITYSVLPACSGTPSGGAAVASNTLLCSPQLVNLSLSGSTSASGLTYQWQSSPNGTAWTSIPTATNSTTSQSVTATTYYQCIVACGSNTAASTPVTVNYGTPPTGGSTVASPTLACIGQNIALSLSGATSATGLGYQWQSSPNGSTWSAISSATAATTTQTTSAAVYYQAVLTCGTNTAASTPVMVSITGPNTYTSVPFLEAFDNTWQNRCDIQNVPNTANWASNPTTGNNSWRRQDAGATANWVGATTGIVTPMGTGAADFHSYEASTGTTGNLDLYINMGTTQNYVMSFYNFNNSGTDSLYVFLSTDGGATFANKGGYGIATAWTKQNITLGAVNSASCVVRFKGVSDFGADDIGVDSLMIFTAACTTPPVAGTITGTTSVAYNSTNTYTISPVTGNIQWYSSSSAAGPYSSIPGATMAVQPIQATTSGTVYYTVIASSTGCPNDTANTPLMVNVNFVGDNVCGAIPLTVGSSTVYYKPAGASVQTGEVAPPGTGCGTNSSWCNNTLNNTMWFTFTAPASGYVSVQSPGFDTQLALWKAAACGDLLSASTATLLAANDDDPNAAAHSGVTYSSYVLAACLTPGSTYYIQLDSYSAASSTDSTLVLITDLGTLDLSFTGLSAGGYCLPSTTSSSLTPATAGGAFTINSGTTTVTAFTPSLTGVGTQTVTYSLFGCMSSSTTVVANTPTISAAASPTAFCAGTSATLTASGAGSYTWAPGGQTTTNIVVTPTASTVYTLTGSSSGCSSTSTINLAVTPNTTVSISAPPVVCTGQSSTLTATGATSYTWMPGGQTTSSIVVTPTVTSTYTVMGNNCGSSTSVATVSVSSVPVVNAAATTTMLCSGQSATITASGSGSYTWAPGGQTTPSIVVSPTVNTTYTVTGTSSCGTATTTITEQVSICTGIDNLSASQGINLYPNPNNGSVTVSVATELLTGLTLDVYDAIGKLVIRETITNAVTPLNTSKLEEGLYLYKIYNNDGVMVKTGRMVRTK